ncbi:lytic transglycosylase domain-containing protein [Yoonia sp. MH D7]
MRLMALAIAMFCAPVAGVAQEVDPRAIEAIEAAQDWDLAYSIAGDADPVTTDLISWMRLRAGDGVFADYVKFTAARPDWPGMDRLRAKGEEAIPDGVDPAAVIAWFGQIKPETGEGAVRLADALIATGRKAEAHAMLIDTWLASILSQTGHDAMMTHYAEVLAPHHVTRADALLWRWRSAEAERMVPHLDAGQAALVLARVGYIKKLSDAAVRLVMVPEVLKDDAGLAYDRFNWLADRGENTDAIAILRARSASVQAMGQPFRWASWRRMLARWEMREGRAQSAYDLAANHFLTEGSDYADLEWISGYVALTYLNQPEVALVHFQRADATVGSPISEGRMQYWIGRSYDVLGDEVKAKAAYTVAAQHQTGFYGLLAAEKLGLALDPALTGASDPKDWVEASFLQDDLVRAALTALQADERGTAAMFFAEVGKRLDATALSQLGALLAEMGEPYFEVLLGKTAAARGIVIPSIYFPLHPLAEMDLPIDASLALSIARRESEFNAVVGSPVGALGLMQLMPATAEEVSGMIGEPYAKSKLTADPGYNARLGSKYLSMLQEQFGNSPVMMAAGYNAGPSRPRAWMAERGDPRVGEMDVIDWIEHIPFRETRNYVMRVTESIPVYEARLTGETGAIDFMALLIGDKPLVRPRIRPDVVIPVPVPVVPVVAGSATPSGPAPAQSLRPISRPGG